MSLLDVLFVALVLVPAVVLAMWVGRRIKPGDEYRDAGSAHETARGEAVAWGQRSEGGGFGL